MRRSQGAALLCVMMAGLLPSFAFGQAGGFSRRQQAGMLAYSAQIRASEQVRRQATLNLINQQFVQQQSAINREQMRSTALMDYLESTDPDSSEAFQGFRPSRRGQAFGSPHFSSPYYMRHNPYYDRQFIQMRNRQTMNLSASTGIPTGSR